MAKASTTTVVTVRFDDNHIGRRHNVEPLRTSMTAADSLAGKIHRYASRYLGSRDVDVHLDIDADTHIGTGSVYVGGFRCVATFTIAPVPDGFAPTEPEASFQAAMGRMTKRA
jgi:hypothetical protein